MDPTTASKVTPFLMFTGRAQEALDLYTTLFDDAEVIALRRYGPEGPGAEGTIMHVRFRIGDQVLMAIDSPPVHAFDFTPSLSLFVTCESEEEIDRLFAGLSEGGFVMMPLSTEHGFAAKYAWLSDRFGVSWQLSLQLDVGEAT
jgi:predicted 3-demethylubiquinone-9 3-methyltransferase (glyoxalase superfamily)